MNREPRAEFLREYQRAVRGGRRPKESFKFNNQRSYLHDQPWISVSRRVDGVYLGSLEKEVGRFLAFSPRRRSPVGSYATRNEAAIALEGVHDLKAHRRAVRERAKGTRR